jgi:CHAD domain-containing protein
MAKRNTRAVAASAAVAAGGALAAGKVVHDWASERAERKRARRFGLAPEETARAGIVRVGEGQLELAISLLDGREDDGPEAIHEARKTLKRVRAVLRLCRGSLGKDQFRQENTILRDAGRSLSGVRDAQVLVETLEGIREPLADELPDATWSGFGDALAADAKAHSENGASVNPDVVTALGGVRERVAVWPLPEEAVPEALATGLKRVYSKARDAWRQAEKQPTDENLHELRKRTKDVWHCGQLLSDVSRKRVRRLRRRAHKLADVLGEDHDLAVLLERADRMPETFGPGQHELLRAQVERRRRTLRRDAFERSAKLYRRKPRKLVRRLSPA